MNSADAFPPVEEKQYTLAEAQMELRRRECMVHGHSYEVRGLSVPHEGKHWPYAVVCDVCRAVWSVVANDVEEDESSL